MAKIERKTTENEVSVKGFLSTVEEESKRKDSIKIAKFKEKNNPISYQNEGNSHHSFVKYHYKYDRDREADMLRVGCSPRKEEMTLYIGANSEEKMDIISNPGKYKTGKLCLYVKKISDLNLDDLKEITKRGFERKQFVEV